MIAEAVDAALLVADALAVWIVAGAVVVTAGVLATVAGVWGICRMLRRAWGAAAARRPQEPAGAPQAPSRVSRDVGPSLATLRSPLSASTPQTRLNRSKP